MGEEAHRRGALRWFRPPVWAVGLALLAAAAARADSQFYVSLQNSIIRQGQSTKLSLNFVNCRPQRAIRLPQVAGLQFRQAGTEQSTTMNIGGASGSGTQKTTWSMNFWVTPYRPGLFAIPAISVVVGGRTLKSSPVELRVLRPNEARPAAGHSQEPAFLRLEVPSKPVYVGEAFPVEICLYYNVGVQNISVEPLSGDGFTFGKNVVTPQTRQVVDNTVYHMQGLEMAATPNKAGELKLGPATCHLTIQIRQRQQQSLGPFGMFPNFFNNVQLRPERLVTKTHTLHVLPLPNENVPPSFTGAVGHYTMAMTAGPTNVAVGEPVTLKIRLKGRGALDGLRLPSLNTWPGFKVYPPTSTVDYSDKLGITGTKEFQVVVVPEKLNATKIPSIALSYFDPDRQAYETLHSQAVPLVVRPTSGVPSLASSASGSSADGQGGPPALVHIKEHLGTLSEIGPPVVEQPWFYWFEGLPVVAWLVLWQLRRRREHLARNPRARRHLAVQRQVRAGLVELARSAQANDADQFFGLTFRLLQEYLGDRLDVPAASITEAVVEEQLKPRGLPEALLTELERVFNLCVQYRFAPSSVALDLTQLAQQVHTLFAQLKGIRF